MGSFEGLEKQPIIYRAPTLGGTLGDATLHDDKERVAAASDTDAAALSDQAQNAAQQGNIQDALDLWQQALEIHQANDDATGQATTLANMAWAAGQTGDATRQVELNLEAARQLGQCRAFEDLITVLGNLGTLESSEANAHLAQAFWLCLRVPASLPQMIRLGWGLVQRLGPESPLAPRVGAAALLLTLARGKDHPHFVALQQDAATLLVPCADARGVSDLQGWIQAENLLDGQRVLPELSQGLEELIGDTWLFDRNTLPQPS